MRDIILLIIVILFVLAVFYGCNPLIYILGDGPDTPPQINKEKENSQVNKREKYVVNHPELTERQKALILAGRLGEGLRKEEIINILDWPKPDIIHSTTEYGADEVWLYKLSGPRRDRKLYFKNTVLIKIKD